MCLHYNYETRTDNSLRQFTICQRRNILGLRAGEPFHELAEARRLGPLSLDSVVRLSSRFIIDLRCLDLFLYNGDFVIIPVSSDTDARALT